MYRHLHCIHERFVPLYPRKLAFTINLMLKTTKKLEFGKFSIKRMFFWKVLLPLHHNCNNLWKKILY